MSRAKPTSQVSVACAGPLAARRQVELRGQAGPRGLRRRQRVDAVGRAPAADARQAHEIPIAGLGGREIGRAGHGPGGPERVDHLGRGALGRKPTLQRLAELDRQPQVRGGGLVLNQRLQRHRPVVRPHRTLGARADTWLPAARSELAAACAISSEMARRDLGILVRLGRLRRVGSARGTRCLASV
jgi:hypothetical protein